MSTPIPIRCYLINDDQHGLIFNPESIRYLREQHRMIGCLTGTLADYPRQNNELGPPLELSREECFLLADRKIIALFEILLPIQENEQDRLNYLADLERDYHQQEIINGHERINEILIKRHTILENATIPTTKFVVDEHSLLFSLLQTNNAWQNGCRTLEEHEREILLSIIDQRLQQFTKDHMFLEVLPESRRTNLQLRSISLEEFQKKFSAMDRLRCDVFADLYDRHYWISDGHKFGGDFLVYLDDPSRCHSIFIVTCVFRNEMDSSSTLLPLTHLIARCRVAVNVHKTCVLASRKSTNIEYLTITWNGF